jgi:hypothetical protein
MAINGFTYEGKLLHPEIIIPQLEKICDGKEYAIFFHSDAYILDKERDEYWVYSTNRNPNETNFCTDLISIFERFHRIDHKR